MEQEEKMSKGLVLAEGKTKGIIDAGNSTVHVVAKNDITAGNGAKRDPLAGKAVLATETTCNVFRLLREFDVPVAYNKRISDVSFSAPWCAMLPYEVVVRRQAYGSYLKRMPALTKGAFFPELLVEFFLKTKDRNWKGYNLPCDDPLMIHDKENGDILLYEDSKPFNAQNPFLVLLEGEVFSVSEEWKLFPKMEEIAKRTFIILENAWKTQRGTLVDFKVEFGLTKDGTLLLADVIDNDSWRVLVDDVHVDKQVYRDGGDLNKVAKIYHFVAEMTRHFLHDLGEE